MSLADARYLSLTTFRKDGTPVATPVWVVSDDGRRLLVWTGADTWKAKRIRGVGRPVRRQETPADSAPPEAEPPRAQ